MAKKEYEISAAVKDAQAAVQEHEQKKPGAYQSEYDGALRETMNALLGQQPFAFRLNGDALYRQYRNQAVRNGRLAMEDTAGQAAALTGGYGNSYAQGAAQQAYARQLDSLSERIPELYTLAMEQYKLRTQGLQEKYQLLSGAEGQAYSRYTDSLKAWQTEADRLMQQYGDLQDRDYDAWRDSVADWKWQEEYDEKKRRYDQEWAAAHPTVSAAPAFSGTGSTQKKQNTQKDTAASQGGALKTIGAVLGALAMAAHLRNKKS